MESNHLLTPRVNRMASQQILLPRERCRRRAGRVLCCNFRRAPTISRGGWEIITQRARQDTERTSELAGLA